MAQADAGRAGRIGNPQDLFAGLMFLGVGVVGLWIALDYPTGTAVRVGTGVFPRILCWALIGLGAVIAIQGFVTSGDPVGQWALRPMLWVSLGILAFAFLLEPLGLVVATLALLLVATIGSPETRWREVAIFAVAMAIFGVAVFSYGLGLSLKVLPF